MQIWFRQVVYICSQRGQMPQTWDIEFMSLGESVRPCVYPENWWYFSKQFHILAHAMYFVLMNFTIFAVVQHTFHFDLDLIAYQVKVTKILRFLHDFCMMGATLCARLSLNRFTNLHILDANKLHNHCGCATHLSFGPWPHYTSMPRSQKHSIFGMPFVCSTRPKPLKLFPHTWCKSVSWLLQMCNIHVLFGLTMTTLPIPVKGHTQHQISLNDACIVYIHSQSCNCTVQCTDGTASLSTRISMISANVPFHADSPSHLVVKADNSSITELVSWINEEHTTADFFTKHFLFKHIWAFFCTCLHSGWKSILGIDTGMSFGGFLWAAAIAFWAIRDQHLREHVQHQISLNGQLRAEWICLSL